MQTLPGLLFAFFLRDKLSGFTLIRLLAEVGKGEGERFGIFPFPNKDASL
jgi:hypothetical protein